MAIQLRQLKAEIVPDLSKLSAGLAQADARFAQFAKQSRPAPQIDPPDQRISQALEAISQSAAKARGDVNETAQALGASGTQASKSERELLQYASAVARLQQASGDAAGAERTLKQALEATETQTRQSIQVATQLERVQGNIGGLKQSFDGLTTSLGSLGVAFGAQQILQFGADSLKSANSLEKTEATTRALAGSTERYKEVLKLAEEGQRNYGGTLEANIQGLGSLVNLSNRNAVELSQLDNIARRLATVDPVQGISGASFALKEFLSTSDASAARSLIERFELSPKLKEIATSGADAKTKMAALNEELNNLGITNEVLSNATNTTANTYDRLGSAFDNAKVAIGSLIAVNAEAWAKALGNALNFAANGLNAFGEIGAKQAELNGKLVTGAKTYDEYSSKVTQVNADLTSQLTVTEAAAARLPVLTERQFNLARALEKQGVQSQQAAAEVTKYGSALDGLTEPQQAYIAGLVNQGIGLDKAIEKTRPLGRALGDITEIQRQFTDSGRLSAEQAESLTQRFTALAAAGGPAGATAEALARGYLKGSIDANSLNKALDQLEQAHRRETNANALAAQRSEEHATASVKLADATALSADETEKFQAKLQTTAERGQEAAERLRDAQTANAQASVERRQQLEESVADQQQQTQARLVDLDSSYLQQRTERAQQNAQQRADVEDAARDKIAQIYVRLADAQIKTAEQSVEKRAQLEARLTDELQRVNERYADLNQGYLAKRNDLEQSAASKRLDIERQSAQQIASIQQRLADSQDTFNEQIADKQQAVQDRIADIRQNAADRSADSEQDYQDKVAELQSRPVKTPEEAARLDAQRAQLDAEFQQKQARAARDDQQAIEKLQRDLARDEEKSRAQLAKQQAALQAQIALEQAALAEKQARQDAADAQERAKLDAKFQTDRANEQQAYEQKIVDLQAAFDRDDATRQTAYAKQTAGLQAQIAAEIVTTSERLQKQDIVDAAELAKIDAKFVKERASILTANDAKLADLQASFDKEEASRATAFAKQEAQLKETLGKQLNDYTESQLKLSLITAEEAARRQKIISGQFGLPTNGEASQEFGALAGGLGRTPVGPTAGSPGAAYAAYRSSQDTYVFNIAGTDTQAITLQIRDELARIQRQNGSTGI